MNGLDKDLMAGLFMIGFGLLFIGLGTDYAFGTPAEMGPGFMPKLLAGGLMALGAINCAASLAARSSQRSDGAVALAAASPGHAVYTDFLGHY
jgi:hypothetical protein